jgi:hypothetical protein
MQCIYQAAKALKMELSALNGCLLPIIAELIDELA